ncbi:MAG TPA: phosphoenolpyruvate--protein phosphotransferase, partial [Pyrinomonadaceae bacterium]|nr:phosphoenolpyruvate--protein phosphotransferase [Pyrinomonadaceae bacterium]
MTTQFENRNNSISPENGAELIIKGRPVSRGIAFGRVIRFFGVGRQFFRSEISENQLDNEIKRFERALELTIRRLRQYSRDLERSSRKSAAIFDVHRAILEDENLIEAIRNEIKLNHSNAEWAIKTVTDGYIAKLRSVSDEHFRDRVIDLEDIAEQLQIALGAASLPNDIGKDAIVAARELRPTTLAELAENPPVAIITESGGWTSHAFILARELGIPAVTGIRKLMRRLTSGIPAIVDGNSGKVVLNPSQKQLKRLSAKRVYTIAANDADKNGNSGLLKTPDGHIITVRANVDLPRLYPEAEKQGAQGIGLFRTEFLINRTGAFPTEAEQVRIYRNLGKAAGHYRARIRTFDIGISQLVEVASQREKNPALGLRALRLGLSSKRYFRTQLRALLQAAADCEIDIILPMVSGVDEIRQVKEILKVESQALSQSGIKTGSPRLGTMIEVPAAVLAIDGILKEVDCLCLGTNDLVQYLLAVDRDNEAVANWFQSLHPAVLRAVRITIEAAKKASKPLVVCGEMSGSSFYLPILIGLGADDFSVNLSAIRGIRAAVKQISVNDAAELANR